MRQKAKEKLRKEAGLDKVAKAKKFDVEEHYDDCGQDLSGLGEDIAKLASDSWVDTIHDLDNENSRVDMYINNT